MTKLLTKAALAGIAGGAAMVPLGLALRRGLGIPLNVYGELLVRAILGRPSAWAMAIEHVLVSWTLALPLVALPSLVRRGHALAVGALYGAALWLCVNSLILPAAFARPTPWQLGWPSIWPSLAVHVLYGAVAVPVARRLARPVAVSPAP